MISQKGFTLIELLIVIAIIGVLAAVVLLAINPTRLIEQANYSATVSNFNQIAKAAQMYEVSTGELPGDTNRNIPTEFMQYLGPGIWPRGPFDGSTYDWDNWTGQTCWDDSPGGIQITLREIRRYNGRSYDPNDFVLYYVIRGEGMPHCTTASTRGICVNCESKYPPN